MPYVECEPPHIDRHAHFWHVVIYTMQEDARRGDPEAINWFLNSSMWALIGGLIFTQGEREQIVKIALQRDIKRITRSAEYREKWLASRATKRAERKAAKESVIYQMPTNETDLAIHV